MQKIPARSMPPNVRTLRALALQSANSQVVRALTCSAMLNPLTSGLHKAGTMDDWSPEVQRCFVEARDKVEALKAAVEAQYSAAATRLESARNELLLDLLGPSNVTIFGDKRVEFSYPDEDGLAVGGKLVSLDYPQFDEQKHFTQVTVSFIEAGKSFSSTRWLSADPISGRVTMQVEEEDLY